MIVKKAGPKRVYMLHLYYTNAEDQVSVQTTYWRYILHISDTTSGRICMSRVAYLSFKVSVRWYREHPEELHPNNPFWLRLRRSTCKLQLVSPSYMEDARASAKDYFNKMKSPGHILHGLLPDAREIPYNMIDVSVMQLPRIRAHRNKASLVSCGL